MLTMACPYLSSLRGYFTDQHRRTMDNSWGPPPPAPQPAQLVPRSASPAQWTTPEANAAHCPSVQLSRARIVADTASPYASSSRRPCSSHDPAYSSHNVRPRLDTTTYNTRTTGSERDRLSSPPPDAATRKRRYVRRLLGPAPADGSEHATRDVEAGPADTVRPKRKYVRRNQPAGAQADKPSTFESPSSAMTTRVTAMSPPRTKRKYVRRARPPESDGDEDSTRTAVYRHDVNRQDGHDVYANPGNRVEPPPRVKRQYIRRVRPAEAAQPADSAGVPADGGARRVAPHGHSIEQPRPQEQRVKRKYIRRVRPLHDEIGDERGLDTAPPRVKRKYVRRTHPSADGGASENSSDRIDLERRRNDVVVRRQQDDSVPRQKRKYTRRVQNVAEEQRQAAGSAAAPPTDQARPRGLNFAMIPLCSDRPRNPEVHSFVSPRYYGINHRVTASALKRIVTTYNSRVDSSLLSISSSGNQHTRDALILADLHTASPPWISTIALDLIRAQRHGIVVAAQQDHDVEVPHSTCIVRGQDGVLSPAASGYEQLLRRQWAVRERGRKWTGSVQSGVSSRRQVNTTALLQAPHILRRNLRGCESAM